MRSSFSQCLGCSIWRHCSWVLNELLLVWDDLSWGFWKNHGVWGFTRMIILSHLFYFIVRLSFLLIFSLLFTYNITSYIPSYIGVQIQYPYSKYIHWPTKEDMNEDLDCTIFIVWLVFFVLHIFLYGGRKYGWVLSVWRGYVWRSSHEHENGFLQNRASQPWICLE